MRSGAARKANFWRPADTLYTMRRCTRPEMIDFAVSNALLAATREADGPVC